jgi:integrating conjugative element protein (TIGR03756 family)
MKKLKIYFLILIISTGLFLNTYASCPVSTLRIIEDTTKAAIQNPWGNYMHYKVIGLCFWVEWKHYYPVFSTTLKVDHFLPDAVVSVYNGYKQNPWDYANNVVDPIAYKAGNLYTKSRVHLSPSFGTSSADAKDNTMKKFKEVDIIGNPALFFVFRALPFAFISSASTSFLPYYSSLADAYLWHNPSLENILHPQYLIPGVRCEGKLPDYWGNIFPRIGFINQLGGFKASAVLALRAADITTNSWQSHVYVPLHSGSCGHECQIWPSHENDFNNVKFQEIYPTATITAKKVFGNLETGINDAGQPDEVKGSGNYVFIMWRHYKGCIQHSGQFLGSVTWGN